ncbi:hypothetical protein D3C75_224230 [compost metagenome]
MSNFVKSVFVDEDGNVGVENKSVGSFKYLWLLMEGKNIGWSLLSVEKVVEELDKWYKEVLEVKDVVEKEKLEKLVEKYKKELLLIDSRDGEFMVCGVWGVEYDSNFSVMYGVFNN